MRKAVGKKRTKKPVIPADTDIQPSAVSDELPENDGCLEIYLLLDLVVERYEGKTCEGQFDGEGVAWFKGGHMYKGKFSKGLMAGTGVFTQAGGLKYEGEFVDNMPMGKGTYTWQNGSTYCGEVYNGLRHGLGTFTCAINGISYTGQWHQGKRHGKGTSYYNEEKTSWYKGDWVKNNREGLGERCYPSGNIYSGEWMKNRRHGEGIMKWVKLGQQYEGTWQNGVQHGQGIHAWLFRRADESQYSQSNRYKGDFVDGQRDGQGTFYYADGAIYTGEWKNNKKHGKGKFTLKDGNEFEGEFVDDKMISPNLNGNRAPIPLGTSPVSDDYSDVVGPSVPLKIECLLEKFPEKKRNSEHEQVAFVVLRNNMELRSIYSFYSRLGHAPSPDNIFILSRLQFWRLLKDCNIHHHGVTLTQIDHVISENAKPEEVHFPFIPMLLPDLLKCLVIVAYHIYNKDMVTQKNILAACLFKLLTDDILPNAKNVKGFLFRQQSFAVVAMNYVERCWAAFQAHSRIVAHRDNQTMTCRHLLWMFKDLRLLDNRLTTVKLLEIITAESGDPQNLSSYLYLEITFLEFFEVLLGCAEIKVRLTSKSLEENRPQLRPEGRKDLFRTKFKDSTARVARRQDVKTKDCEIPQTAGMHGGEVRDHKLELRIQTVHQFFNHFFFPAFNHHLLVTKTMVERRLRQEARAQRQARKDVSG